MIKVALIVVFTSFSNADKAPDVDISNFYKTMAECQNDLDQIKNSLNAQEVTIDGENRVLKLISREMHQQGVIHWFCKKKYKE
tara:strand:+ start:237 stop:485 length:249 start_codon:yes stop_codon:yes gene_type:complete